MSNWLGLDYGARKIGLAIGDLETKIASPFKILVNGPKFESEIKAICQQENIAKVVIGLPQGMQGNKSEQYEEAINFGKKLHQTLGLEVIFQDEKLTSTYAQKLLQGTKAKGNDDAVAAMLILQGYFDKLK